MSSLVALSPLGFAYVGSLFSGFILDKIPYKEFLLPIPIGIGFIGLNFRKSKRHCGTDNIDNLFLCTFFGGIGIVAGFLSYKGFIVGLKGFKLILENV